MSAAATEAAAGRAMMLGRGDVPCVLRRASIHWPATQRWEFPFLASLSPGLPVQLVVGNREMESTRFETSNLGSYLARLASSDGPDEPPRYLKEFDLLKAFPALRKDLRMDELFPHGTLVSCGAWIGPTGARTGLHADLLPNIATVLRGRKRFHLAGPNTVSSVGAVSDKHDRWATLARINFEALQARCRLPEAMHTVDVEAGDAIYIPAGWWHEVVNLEPSILLSGFFGSKAHMARQWLQTGATHALHLAGLWRKGNCTCHA